MFDARNVYRLRMSVIMMMMMMIMMGMVMIMLGVVMVVLLSSATSVEQRRIIS